MLRAACSELVNLTQPRKVLDGFESATVAGDMLRNLRMRFEDAVIRYRPTDQSGTGTCFQSKYESQHSLFGDGLITWPLRLAMKLKITNHRPQQAGAYIYMT
jgi:hypothetical protein